MSFQYNQLYYQCRHQQSSRSLPATATTSNLSYIAVVVLRLSYQQLYLIEALNTDVGVSGLGVFVQFLPVFIGTAETTGSVTHRTDYILVNESKGC